MLKVKFRELECNVEFSTDYTGDLCINLVEEGKTYPLRVCTLPPNDMMKEHGPLDDNCVWIKDYSENAGVLDALVKGGIVEVISTEHGGFAGIVPFYRARVLTPLDERA